LPAPSANTITFGTITSVAATGALFEVSVSDPPMLWLGGVILSMGSPADSKASNPEKILADIQTIISQPTCIITQVPLLCSTKTQRFSASTPRFLYIYRRGANTTYMLLYIENIILTASSLKLLHHTTTTLQ
jgi:hypothetical protein